MKQETVSDVRNHDHIVGLKARLDRAIDSAIEDRRIVGTVVVVAERGDIVYSRAAGFADREPGRSMQENCIFLLASVAKPIVTARITSCGSRADSTEVTRTSMKSSGGFRPLRSVTSRAADGATPWRSTCSGR